MKWWDGTGVLESTEKLLHGVVQVSKGSKHDEELHREDIKEQSASSKHAESLTRERI